MVIAHHALEVFDIPASDLRDLIPRVLADAGFQVAPASPSDGCVRARRGSAMGVTDANTGRVMEVIIRGMGQNSAVSVYHHTSGVGPFVGATFGDILRDEVNRLFASLARRFAEAR